MGISIKNTVSALVAMFVSIATNWIMKKYEKDNLPNLYGSYGSLKLSINLILLTHFPYNIFQSS